MAVTARHIGARTLQLISKRAFHLPAPVSCIPNHSLLDEELCPGYNPENYYPAKPGGVLGEQFQLLAKVGWGTSSTVWLARSVNGQSEESIVIKILNNNRSENDDSTLQIEQLVSEKDPSHQGYVGIRPCLGLFELVEKERKHMCLMYEPMREPMTVFQQRWPDRKMPLVVAKAYIYLLLLAMDYLHTECRVIHTDLKLSNIMMTLENDKILPQFIQKYVLDQPAEYKTNPQTGRSIYSGFLSFAEGLDPAEYPNLLPKITDFGSSLQIPKAEHDDGSEILQIGPIQSDYYRAPEVTLGYGWTFGADIWNFGVLVWNIIEGTELFTQVQDSKGQYDPKSHLAEMVALLGPLPKNMLKRMETLSQRNFCDPGTLVRRFGNDKTYKTSRELFGGPYFDEEGEFSFPRLVASADLLGNFLHEDLIPKRKLEDTFPSIPYEEKEVFLSFARDMLTWDPAKRKTARQLSQHPFLDIAGKPAEPVE